jgi:hypothetical protein
MKEQLLDDLKKIRYPYSVVWTPLPFLTALFPFIGHTGVCSGEGVIHDFGSSFYINVDNMAFGNPTKFVKLELTAEEHAVWDRAVFEADELFKERRHSLLRNN